jgi:hypothetical protein
MEASYEFRFSEDHLLQSFLRYRKQLWWRRPFYAAKGLLVFVLVALAVVCVATGFVIGAGIFGGVIGIALIAWPLDAWVIRRRFRKSPYHDDQISFRLSNDGVVVSGQNHNVRADWNVFTKARRFRDGMLLFQGPHFFTWLPDSAVAVGSSAEEANNLVRNHVKDYRDV